jgi:large subunit ribosomal protein L15
MVPINLDRIQAWIDQKRLDPTAPITLRELHTSRALHGTKDGVKLLANGAAQLKTPINIIVSKASRSAIAAVEAVGGTVTTRFYTPQAIRRIKQGVMHPFVSLRWDPVALKAAGVVESGSESEATADADADAASSADAEDHYSLERRAAGMGYSYRLPDPTSRKDLEYYRDPANRGYLSHTVAEGHGPSLYFKPPVSEEELKALRKKSGRTGRAGKAKQENKLW